MRPFRILPALFSVLFLVSSISAQNKKYSNPFDTLKYDKVVAYDYNGSPEMDIVKNGRIQPPRKRILLEKEMAKPLLQKLIKVVGDTKNYGGSTMACFDPHFGVVFYLQGKIVAHMSVCMACNYIRASPEIPAMLLHKSPVCAECYLYGFSKKGRKAISEIVKELHFSHWQLDSYLDK